MTIRDLIPWKREDTSVPVKAVEDQSLASLQRSMNSLFDDFFEDPFGAPLSRFSRLTDSLNDSMSRFTPAMDLTENEKAYELTLELPGMDEEDIQVTLEDDLLTISGEKRSEREEKGKQSHYVERSYGSFSRSLRVPAGVDQSAIEASVKKGVLHLTLPKLPEAQTRTKQIKIKKA